LVEQGTFNPKVAGSIPARPIQNSLYMGTFLAQEGVRSDNVGQQDGSLRRREDAENEPEEASTHISVDEEPYERIRFLRVP
jgi:hypothetical protein